MVQGKVCGAQVLRCEGCERTVSRRQLEQGGCPHCPPGTPSSMSTCRCPALSGTAVCQHHGGRGMRASQKARQKTERATERAKRLVVTYGLRRDINPWDALLEEIARTAGAIDYLGAIVASLDKDELVWGRTSVEAGTGAHGASLDKVIEAAAPSVWLRLYQAERRHLVTVSTATITAGLAERQVGLAEEQGRVVADVFRRVLSDPELGLSGAQLEVSHGVVSRHLRALVTVS